MTKYLMTFILFFFTITLTIGQGSKTIDANKSSVTWTGKKVTGSHTGQINITKGALLFESGRLSGGSFTIDMTSLTNTDLGENMRGKLEGHLKSDDFFGVANYPTANLTITNVSPIEGGYSVTGDLTIKGTTEPVIFDATLQEKGAKAKIIVDRTKYHVKYGSGKFFENLGDKMVYDNFDLEVNLAF